MTPKAVAASGDLVLSVAGAPFTTVTVGLLTAIPGVSLSAPDDFADETFFVTVAEADEQGVLSASGAGVAGSGSRSLTISGSLAQVNVDLAGLAVTESQVGSDILEVTASDSLGDAAAPNEVAIVSDPLGPRIAAPDAVTDVEGFATALPGISLAEPGDIAGESFTVTVTDATGTLTATGPGVAGSGTTALTVAGSLADVNAALATLAVSEGSTGSDTIVINASDGEGRDAAPVDIAVSALDPAIAAPATLAVAFDQGTAIPGISLDDPTNSADESYVVQVSDAHGLLSAASGDVAGNATTTLTITGALADVNAALATLLDVSNTPGQDTITLSATDSAGTPVTSATLAVTTGAPALAAATASEDDTTRVVTGFGSISDTQSGQFGTETGAATATGGADPAVTASVSASGTSQPLSYAEAAITLSYVVVGAPGVLVPVVFSGTVTTAASPGSFGATASVSIGITAESLGDGPSGDPASVTFAKTVEVRSDEVYQVTYDAIAEGPGVGGAGTGTATASVDPTIAIDSGFADAGMFTLVTDAVPCFLAGTRILTERGELPVEGLKVGDRVVTVSGGREPIVWIGRGRKLVPPGRRSDATPVLVRRDALGPGVPRRDLRVTQGHSLLLDGALVAAELLVNHRSIVWDDDAREVEFHHVELARHDVLLAEGAAAESYRDDGRRALFETSNGRWHLPPQPPCAPLLTGGPVVDAVWRRLLERAGPAMPVAVTDDPDLHLLVDGRRVDGSPRDGAHSFRLSRRPGEVRVVSRSAVLSELGLARDHRRLGVAVRRIGVSQGARSRWVEAADPSLGPGFHAFEPESGWRWTDGDAPVPRALFKGVRGPSELELHLGGTTRYPVPAAAVRVAA